MTVKIFAPASANIIGKMANGIADDMLSTMVLAADCKIIVSPAMNTHMYKNNIVQNNIKKLKDYGFEIIEPVAGMLACRAIGEGKLPDEEVLVEYIKKEIEFEKDMNGINLLVTAGPTIEKIDPVRYITNHSSGKMGYAIADIASKRGANVKLISGPTNIKKPLFANITDVKSADDMHSAVMNNMENADIIIKAAAIADYTIENPKDEKMKKKDADLKLELRRTKDILKSVGERKRENQVICGFSMETNNLIENSKKKLISKNCDMIVANNLNDEGAGFKTDTNKITIITKDIIKNFDVMPKREVAGEVLNRAVSMYKEKNN